MSSTVRLRVLADDFAVVRLPARAELPEALVGGRFVSVTRTADELSVVCPIEDVPGGATVEPGWSCLQVEGPLDFSLSGVLAALIAPLADAEVSVLVISTWETDFLFVRTELLQTAVAALQRAGHSVG